MKNNKEIYNWLDGLSKLYAKYEAQQSTENLSLLLGYISSASVAKNFLNTEIDDFKSILLRSHLTYLTYLEEEVKRLEGKIKSKLWSNGICESCDCYEDECDCYAFNSAIQQEIDLKKKEIEEIKY
jgi:hypothetical protein